MKITREALLKIIQEEYASAHEQGKTLVKEDWVDQLYNALYALEDNVEGVVIDTELEQVYRKFHSMLKAHILEKSKVRDASRKDDVIQQRGLDEHDVSGIEEVKGELIELANQISADPDASKWVGRLNQILMLMQGVVAERRKG